MLNAYLKLVYIIPIVDEPLFCWFLMVTSQFWMVRSHVYHNYAW